MPPKGPRKLSPKRLKFVELYLKLGNATQAAIGAGYSKKTARTIGSALLTNLDIQAMVKKASDKSEVTNEQIVKEMDRVGRSDIGDLFDADGRLLKLKDMSEDARRAIRSIEVVDGVPKITLWDKTANLANLAKIKGMLRDKTEVELGGRFIVQWGGDDKGSDA